MNERFLNKKEIKSVYNLLRAKSEENRLCRNIESIFIFAPKK